VAQRTNKQKTQSLNSYNKEWYTQYYAQNRIWLLANQREYEQRIKLALMDILGGRKCKFCGNDDLRVLEIEHKNGDGSGDRKQFKNNRQLRRFYIMHPDLAREILQVSCANCNKIKRYEKQEWHAPAGPAT
jgi:hypothetical protein